MKKGSRVEGRGSRGKAGAPLSSDVAKRPRPSTLGPRPSVKAPPPGDRPLKTLERVLSKAGLGSRKEARRWIGEGRVKVNGRTAGNPDAWVDLERDTIAVDGRPLQQAAAVYLLLHKPTGYLTTYRDPQGRKTIYDLLPDRDRYLFPVGRLDLDTSGLLILTNDTAFAERLTNPDYKVPKTYRVKASRHLTDADLERLRTGIELRDGMTRPAIVERLRDPGGKTVFEITITEGRNRQVRRMVEALNAKVISLARIAIGSILLGDLEPGTTRELNAEEVRLLREWRA
jgi:23S rRNA pseudouridine2605 synthase